MICSMSLLFFNIVWHLLLNVGCVFFVLSSSSTIWQAWLSVSEFTERKNPYVLFSISNLGSFLALLFYPFIFELYFDLGQLQHFWRILYFVLCVTQGLVLYKIVLSKARLPHVSNGNSGSISRLTVASWLLYSASGVILFMSVTNILTLDIAPMPLLWMVPLAIYLFSFFLNFKKKPLIFNWCYKHIEIFFGISILFYIYTKAYTMPIIISVAGYLLLLFLFCMFVQFRLYDLKPDRQHLGKFYFIVSLGGFLGGVLVAWVIPKITTSLIEFVIGLFVIILGLIIDHKSKRNIKGLIITVLWVGLLFIWPQYFTAHNFFEFILILIIITVLFYYQRKQFLLMSLGFLVIIITNTSLEAIWSNRQDLFRYRNYYGMGRVYDRDAVRFFEHGSIIHGAQFLDKKREGRPLAYFSLNSPIGEVLTLKDFHRENIAIFGLGTGVLSTYAWADQNVDFYELEPDVFHLANEYFSFLRNASGNLNYIYGDARINLCKNNQKYDFIIQDAFSGDTIPTHLLTKEALICYRDHMNEDGLLIFHLSNKFIENGLPLISTALSMGGNVCFKNGPAEGPYIFKSTWVIVTWDKREYDKLVEKLKWKPVNNKLILQKHRIWSDSYSSLLPYIKWQEFWLDLKNSNFFKITRS